MTTVFTFPGQGSQSVGMGQDLAESYPEARAVFQEVDEALNESLSATMWEGPDDVLTLTQNAQPALMAVSLAVVRVLAARGVEVAHSAAYVAGHSLGEYSALAAAGSLTVGDAARLLRTRGEAMQQAVPVGAGAMAALIGLDFAVVEDVVTEAAAGQVCAVANDNGGGQVVVSGDRAAVERAVTIAKDRGARRAVILPVSAPFHCALMAPAAEVMKEALADVTLLAPAVPVVSNVTAGPVVEPEEIRGNLVAQVTGMVRWRESMSMLAESGADRFAEIGSGKVLTGLVRRIVPDAQTMAIGKGDDIETAVAQLTSNEMTHV